MKKIVTICLSIILSGLLLSSCVPKDEKLQKDVEMAISNTCRGISKTVKKGVARLEGVVDSEQAKLSIENMARAIQGVKSVENNITVKVPEPPVTINPDNTINTTITNALTAAGFKDVKVEVNNGEVTLTGDVKRADLTKVMQIANESNPKKVHNNLKIK